MPQKMTIYISKLQRIIGLRLFEFAEQSAFRDELENALAAWLHHHMTRIVTSEGFRLRRPQSTVPPIEEVLKDRLTPRVFIAQLLLAAVEGIGVNIGPQYRAKLSQISTPTDPSPVAVGPLEPTAL
jgi:hypothetical protein